MSTGDAVQFNDDVIQLWAKRRQAPRKFDATLRVQRLTQLGALRVGIIVKSRQRWIVSFKPNGRAQRAGAMAGAVRAVAVPLREPAAGGRTEDGDAHGSKDEGRRVRSRAAAPASFAQRAATYIVISKPKRKSVAVGVCHCMRGLLRVARHRAAAAGMQSSRDAWSRRPLVAHSPPTMIRAS